MERKKFHKTTTIILLLLLAFSPSVILDTEALSFAFTAAITPNVVYINQTRTYTVNFTNTGDKNLGSAAIIVPTEFSAPSSISILDPPSSWTCIFSNGALNLTSNSSSALILPGGSLIFSFSTTAPVSPGLTNWTATASSNNAWGGTALTLEGEQPTVNVVPQIELFPPAISASNNTINQGQTSLISQSISPSGGTLPYNFQWFESFNGGSFSPITDANGPSFAFSTTTSTEIGTWSFKLNVTDNSPIPLTVTSNSVDIQVNSALTAPTVTATPNNIYEVQTSNLDSSPVTTGTPPYVYQWFERPPSGIYAPVGTNSPTYTFPGSTTTGNWAFLLQVTDSTGTSVNSTSVDITVSSTPLFTITVTQGLGGTINPGTSNIILGGTQVFNIVPNLGYDVADILVDGVSVGAITSYTFTNVNNNHNITATFTQTEYPLFISVVGSGSVIKSPDQTSYHYGDLVQLTATPLAGWSFSGWSGDFYSSTNQVSILINGSTSVTSTFILDAYALTAAVLGSGIINKVPEQASYNLGDTVTLTATPNPGWSFNGWSGDLSSMLNPISVIINGTTSVTATFTQNEYSLAISIIGGGSVISNPSQASYHYGDQVQLTAIPSPGWRFSGWAGDLIGSANSSSITINGNNAVTAVFVIDQLTITASANQGGSISPPGITVVDYGGTQTYAITPSIGYYIADVLINGTSVGPLSAYTVSNVTGDTTITVSFALYTLIIDSWAGSHGSINPSGTVAVYYGYSQNFTISPDTGYHVADVLVDGISVGPVTFYTFTNVISNHNISASFEINTYLITANAGPYGTISPDGNLVFNWNATPTFIITPQTDYYITNVLVDGVAVGPLASYTFSAITTNHNITAEFGPSPPYYFITVTSSHGSPTPTTQINAGDNFTISVTNYEGDNNHRWICTGYSIDGGLPVSGTSYTFLNVIANHTIAFNWQEQYYLTIFPSDNSTTGDGWYNKDAEITISATSLTVAIDSGTRQVFTGWTGDATGTDTTSAPIIMNGAKTASATWKTQHLVTYHVSGNMVQVAAPQAEWVDSGTPSTGTFPQSITNSVGNTRWILISDDRSPLINGPITITGTYQTQYLVIFTLSGVAPDASGIVATVHGETKKFENLPNSLWINAFDSVTFDYTATFGSTETGKQYILTSTNSTSPLIVNEPTTILAYYEPKINTSNLNLGTIALAAILLSTIPASLTTRKLVKRRKKTHKITPFAGEGGSISPNTVQKVERGGSSTVFIITADSGYKITDVVVDNAVHVGATRTFKFSNVKENHTIKAIFQKN